MPALSDYTAGTITLTNASTAFTGTGTGWQAADFREGDTILGIESNGGDQYVVETITGNAAGTLTQPWEGASGTYTYRMRYLADGARVTAQARELIELLGNGNLQSIGGLTGPGVVVLEGPHSAGIRPFTDFINGVAYDVQVDTLSDRAAYDGQTAGFAVLVSNVGDGRSALYTKVTNASGDWSDPAYITGPVGPEFDVTVGPTTTLPPDQPATVTPVDIPGGVRLDFSIPRGPTGDITGVTTFWNTRLGADADAAAARGGLGSDNAANLIAGIIANARLPGRLTNGVVLGSDYNLALENGFYGGTGDPSTNAPPGNARFGWLLVTGLNSVRTTQIAGYGMELYYRSTLDGGATWTLWDLLVPVYGSNANGKFIKYPGRVMECWHTLTAAGQTAEAFGNIWFGGQPSWTFPAAFSSAPSVDAMNNASGSRYWVTGGGGAVSTTAATFQIVAGNSADIAASLVSVRAIGVY